MHYDATIKIQKKYFRNKSALFYLFDLFPTPEHCAKKVM